MKKTTRVLAMLLLLCLAMMTVSACNDDSDDTSTPVSSGDTSATELFANLPEKNYEGATVTFLVPGDDYGNYKSAEIMEQENSPEALNDEIKKRNELVETKFGVTIEEVRASSSEPIISLVREDILSSNGDYDIVMPYIPNAATLALESAFYELNDLQYFDINADCWDQNAVEALSINNKNYFVTGDISLLTLACTHAIVFNKDMLTKNFSMDPSDLYQIVENGEWTIDKLREMASTVTADTDGQAGMSYKDTYGFLINNNFVTSMFIGSGQKLTGKSDDDTPYIAVIKETESAATVFTKIFELVNDANATGQIDVSTSSYYTSAVAAKDSVWTAATESVANGLALFRAMSIIDIIDLGEYECNFGIIPVPKYDKNQDNYYSNVSVILSTCVAIPVSAVDPEMSAIIAQAMCEASTETTKHAYYDVILKLRKIQDDESEAMLDKIFADRVYDLGIVFNWGGSGVDDPNSIGAFMNNVAFSGSQTFASTLESISSLIESDLEETLEAFDK